MYFITCNICHYTHFFCNTKIEILVKNIFIFIRCVFLTGLMLSAMRCLIENILPSMSCDTSNGVGEALSGLRFYPHINPKLADSWDFKTKLEGVSFPSRDASFVSEWAKRRVKKSSTANACIRGTASSSDTTPQSDDIQSVNIPGSVPLRPVVPPLGSITVQMGEFVKVYSAFEQESQFDCVVTCFFIDTAGDILEYLAVVAHILRPGEPCNTVNFVAK
jgi:N2227-like protein